MPKARISYNAQDLFFGLPTGEATELPGHHILRRINRVQSIDYGFSVKRAEINVIGKTARASRPILGPPQISLDFNYFLDGVGNERSMGFDVADQISPAKPLFIEGFFNESRAFDSRNIYIVTHNSDLDVRGSTPGGVPAEIALGLGNPEMLIDDKSTNYGVLVFQNAYVSNYSSNISVGTIPAASVSCVADNVIYFVSGSGVDVPFLNLKNGTSYVDGTRILIPKHYKEDVRLYGDSNSAFKPSNITIDIQKQTITGISFHTEALLSFSLDLPLNRENVSYLGYKLYADRPLQLPIKSSLALGFLDSKRLSGSFLNEVNRDDNYNFEVSFKKGDGAVALKYVISGARFESFSRSSAIGDNASSEMNFTVEMDFDKITNNGIFVSGTKSELAGAIIDDYGNVVTDDFNVPLLL